MKKKKTLFIIMVLVIFVLISSLFIFDDKESTITHSKKEITENVKIDEKNLNVTYKDSNMIDTELTYGNTITKEFKVTNNNDISIIYALKFNDSSISNEDVTYSLYESLDGSNYTELKKNESIKGDTFLIYNLIIESNKDNYFKIIFKSNKENTATILKGIINVSSNLTESELFIKDINNIQEKLINKINSLNGINSKGYYIINIADITNKTESNLFGYILIDASDISSLKYYYTVYNTKYMLYNYKHSNDIKISKNDSSKTSNIDFKSICNNYDNKITCSSFSSIPYTENGGKNNFYNNINTIIENTKKIFVDKTNLVYVIDVTSDIENSSNIRGYIVIDNTNNNSEYYLYLTDNLFMVSGYNYTKLGNIDINGTTIRSYNESAFNLSAANKKTACNFSGFSSCVDINGGVI